MPLAPLQFIDSEGTNLSFNVALGVEPDLFLMPGGAYPDVEIQIVSIDGYAPCFIIDNNYEEETASFDTIIDVGYGEELIVTDDTHVTAIINLLIESAGDGLEFVAISISASFGVECSAEWLSDSGALESWNSGVVF